jgi:hypothetical protein
MSVTMVRDLVHRAAKALTSTRPEFVGVRFSPRDFRRLFATNLVNNGLPIDTRGYVAVFDEDVVRHYQVFLTGAGSGARPASSARPPGQKWPNWSSTSVAWGRTWILRAMSP